LIAITISPLIIFVFSLQIGNAGKKITFMQIILIMDKANT